MFRRLFRVQTYHLAGLIPLYEYKDPYDDTEPKVRKQPVTGWERVKVLFEYTENGYVSEEYIANIQLTGFACAAAFILAGGFESYKAFDNFLVTNQATKFISAYEARRKLQDHIILQGMKQGTKYALKCGTFTFFTGMGSIIIAAYRGKEGILEYTLGAGIAGAIVRLYVGFTATAVGFGVGALVGTLIGTMIWGLGKISGTTFRDTQKMLFDLKESSDKKRSDMAKRAQQVAYQGNPLKQWFNNKMTTPEHKLADEDKRYIVQSPTSNAQLELHEDDVENKNKSEENTLRIPIAVNSIKSPNEQISVSPDK